MKVFQLLCVRSHAYALRRGPSAQLDVLSAAFHWILHEEAWSGRPAYDSE